MPGMQIPMATLRDTDERLTGERPRQGVTPDSLLALHDAGYRAVLERVGKGPMLDVGCGEGFESARLAGPDRPVVGADYSQAAARLAQARFADQGLHVACMDATALSLAEGSFASVCSSHLIEHFVDPEAHVVELARVLHEDGSAYFLTPNKPADFENPFHVHLFDRDDLVSLLERHFAEVWVGGVDAVDSVKAELAARRAKANKVLALDVFDLRHRIPRDWYVAAYTKLLPIAYRVMARRDTGGTTGITEDDWFVTDTTDDTTLVLFAIARRPRRPGHPPSGSYG